MKRVFIIHGWDFNPTMHWYPWLKKELENKGFSVYVPEMPNTSTPIIKDWVAHLKSIVGKLDSNTYFIGHSIGCQTIMRYLENEKDKCGGAVFVAGWFKLDNLEDDEVERIAEPWVQNNIDFAKVKNNINKLSVFLSSNDPYECLEYNKNIFESKLVARVIVLKDKGHFTQEEGVTKIPELLSEFIKIAIK
jgi:predicted alpha/beta hydrolase family esterase